MMRPEHLIAACWILFVLYWMISARSIKPAAERQSRAAMLAHKLPVCLGAILMLVPRADPFGTPIIPDAASAKWLGAFICVLGLLGAFWSRKILADNWSNDVEFKQGHQLIESGPYHFVRHPIYSSILLMLFGAALTVNRFISLASLVLFFAGFFIKLKQEERLLLRHLPAGYPAYKARTKMLLPFVF
jgi:protein-S-isoprenylcysteine O-methyltransferase Ste14